MRNNRRKQRGLTLPPPYRAPPSSPTLHRMRVRLLAAFAAVYFIWGSTYLAIRFAVETLPPLLMASVRFLLAGAALLLWARRRTSAPALTASDWRTGVVSGVLMLGVGNGAVVLAEQTVPSGIAALLVAVVPLWMVLIDWLRPRGRRPHPLVFGGIAFGMIGLALLVGPTAVQARGPVDARGVLVLMVGSLAWALGSLYTQWAPRSSAGLSGAATQMLAGGTALLLVAVVAGDLSHFDPAAASRRSLAALLYLMTFGSLIGFTAYVYLLTHTSAVRAATYAYVNPVVAVFLGWAFAGEPVTGRTLVAAAVILGSVAIITVARDSAARTTAESRAAA